MTSDINETKHDSRKEHLLKLFKLTLYKLLMFFLIPILFLRSPVNAIKINIVWPYM